MLAEKEITLEITASGEIKIPRKTAVKARKTAQKERYYYIMQKLIGIILIELGALTVPISGGDGTGFVILLLFGIPLIFSKEKILTDWRK